MKVKGREDLAIGFLNSYMAVAKRGSTTLVKTSPSSWTVSRTTWVEFSLCPPSFGFIVVTWKGITARLLPNAQWEYVKATAARVGVRCVNLTGPLVEESGRLLPAGKLTFWRDDSHWNRYGVAVAARMVHNILEEH